MRRGRLSIALATLAAAGLAASGCGADDHPNEPRPPSPIELTGKIKRSGIEISPESVGAGPAVITVANLTAHEAQPTFSGPTEKSADPIRGNGVGGVKLLLDEGTYRVTAGPGFGGRAAELEVGPERPSSQNELLLP